MLDTYTQPIADRWAGEHCYVEIAGVEYPAKIAGKLLPIGSVAPIDSRIPAVSFSWHVIGRIMLGSKLFRS